ncbi:dehydrogenase/reductase SDR family member 7-like [Haliotis rubra]|uniref:dehydrogenase/reductase SDR family member 7-like n=1 Tax=Haliotis rubra TaxID=36100 RepID=UPI001EE5D757|nr:dehydrogenase/reductase SDR family member 7-like [Haliotis rubra]
MFLELLVSAVVTVVVVQVLRLFFADCDLTLQWAEMFGRSPGEACKGKVVWVTGASSGIGEGLAYRLAAAGCRLILSARREDELNRVKKTCLARYGGVQSEDILVVPVDLVQRDTHQQAVDTVIQHFKQIDCLVNNAGRSQRALWMKTSLEVDKECLELNTLGPLSLTKLVLPQMVQRKQGQVVVVTSIAGKFGAPGIGSYCGSKHALHGWFESLRIEGYDDNIKVTMVCPGPVFSDALKVAFTEQRSEGLGVEMRSSENRMATDRCAHLIAVAMSNSLDEVWVSRNPELSYCYLFQYFPAIARKIAVRLGQTRYRKVKAGINSLH